jgi:hypothetical protein
MIRAVGAGRRESAVSTDAGWGDYLSADTPAADTGGTSAAAAEPVLPEPAASIVENEVAGAAADQDWANWHAATGNSWSDSANDYVQYAQESAAAGYTDAAASALDTAATHAGIAEGHYQTATDYSSAAATHVDTAAAEAAPYTDASGYSAGLDADVE